MGRARSVFLSSSYTLRDFIRGRTETWKANDSVFGGVVVMRDSESRKKKKTMCTTILNVSINRSKECAIENRDKSMKK